MPNVVVHLIKQTLVNLSFPGGENQFSPTQIKELITVTGTVV